MAEEEFRIASKYTVIGDIAVGQVSDVYEVVEDGTANRFALKLLREETLRNPQLVAQFKQEIKLGVMLEHPNLVNVFDSKVKVQTLLPVKDPIAFFTMEMFRSQNLKGFCASNPLGVQRRLKRLLEQICEALIYLHSNGWVHRDIKPDNILMNKAAEVRLIDFSLIVKIKKKVRKIQGTRSYIAPEMIDVKKRGRAVPQTDIYNLGVTVYEILTGKPPFVGSSPSDLLKQHIAAQRPNPSDLNGNVTPEMDRLVTRMMAREVKNRHASAEELLGEIRNINMFREEIEEPVDGEDTREAELKSLIKELNSREDAERTEEARHNPELAKEVEAQRKALKPRTTSKVVIEQADGTLRAPSTASSEVAEETPAPPAPLAPPQQPVMPGVMPAMPMPPVAPAVMPGMPMPPVAPAVMPGMPMPGMPMPGMPMPGMPMPMPMPGMPMPMPGMPMPGAEVPMPGMPGVPQITPPAAVPAVAIPPQPLQPQQPPPAQQQPGQPQPPMPAPSKSPPPATSAPAPAAAQPQPPPPASQTPPSNPDHDLPLMEELPDVE